MSDNTFTKTSKKPHRNRFAKLKALATGKAKPFLAILIVLGVVGMGYYGYLRSNADTLGNTPPTVTCGKKLSDKECRQKQAASDAAFYAQLSRDCSAANRIYSNNGCGGCQKGFFDKDGTCKERQKVDCSAQNLIQKDDYNCGGCKAGFFDKDGTCKERQKVDCALENRVQSDPYTCGNCKIAFTEVGGNCITRLNETVALQCAKQHKNYDASTNSCTTCVDTYELSGTTCKKKTTTETPPPHSPPLTPGNSALTQVDCDKVLREFNTTTKQCGDCKAGYVEKSGGCAKVLSTTEQCAINGNGRCMAPQTVKKVCETSHRQYDSKANTCKDECVGGWYLESNVCNKISTVDASKVKASCDKQFLQYDRETNRCLEKCKATYVMRDSKCVAWTEAGMTQWRCNAMGRVWIPGTPANGETAATTGSCAVKCVTDTAKYVDTGSDSTSYCKATNSTIANAGVAVNVTREECAKQHRAWIGALEGCSARCQSGWYLNDGKCTEVKPAEDGGLTEEGDGAAGGCSLPLQTGTLHIVRRPTLNTVTICPEDEPNVPPVTTAPNVPVTHDVAVLMDHATCTALGRAWVPDANTVNGKKRGGCSTQECIIKSAEVRRSNGSAYCEGSVDRIGQKECNKTHRDWIPEVNACAAVAVKKSDNRTTINAKQCDPPYTVYVQHTEKQGADECVKPSAFQRLQGIAEQTSRPVSYLASLGSRALCNLQDNKQWIDGKCVKKRVPSNNPSPAGATGSTGTGEGSQTTTGGTSGTRTQITAAWCKANFGRGYDAAKKTCSRQCVTAGYQITNYSDPSRWDVCQRSNGSSDSTRCPSGWHYVSAATGCQRDGSNGGVDYPDSDQSHAKKVSCGSFNTIARTQHNCISGSKCLPYFGAGPEVKPYHAVKVSFGQNGTLYYATDACELGA